MHWRDYVPEATAQIPSSRFNAVGRQAGSVPVSGRGIPNTLPLKYLREGGPADIPALLSGLSHDPSILAVVTCSAHPIASA